MAGPVPDRVPARVPDLRALVSLLVSTLLAGVVVGALWRLSVPTATSWAASGEQGLAPDVALAVLGVLAGAAVAAGVLLRPGPGSPLRFVVALAGSGLGSLVAWGLGYVTGAGALTVPGVLVVWPCTTALVTTLVTLVILVVLPAGD